jgi:hydroxymethylglutaryl-CoA lyase
VPQFVDASDVLRRLSRKEGVSYKATCANIRAVERAVADLEAGYGAKELSLLVSASDTHSRRNLNRPREEQWQNIADMVRVAEGRFRLVGTISVAFGCPFEGKVEPSVVVEDAQRFLGLGVRYITLGDTTGMATPTTVKEMFTELRRMRYLIPIAHFHDSRGTGLVNYVAAYQAGVRHFDTSFGGVGGHPAKVKYGGGYTGNVCTEDLVSLFESMGIPTGIDLDGLLDTARFCEKVLGRELHGHVTRSGVNPLLDRPVGLKTRVNE